MNNYDDDYLFSSSDEEPLTVDCDVTITITRRMKLQVEDAVVSLDGYDDEVYEREVDFSSVDWNEVLADNDVVPQGWHLDDSNVTPQQW